VTIQFTSANTYSVNGSGSFAFTAGAAININGWSATINGAPATGDSFQIKPGAINSADNGNAKLLGALGSKSLLDGGRSSLVAANAALISQTGNTAQQASLRYNAAQAIQAQTTKDHDAVSGVNLDEEAADLVRYQQAYQAAAQIISTAQTAFQALLDAARG
jgi:flagellar hook-associated protein 1 FlgK